jgi:hypothetical protein
VKPEKPAPQPAKPAPKPEKAAPKPVAPPAETKPVKTETGPRLIETLDQELPARKKADALTKQGQKAIVRKVKKGDKTVYQVWTRSDASGPVKPATPKANPR